MLPNGITLQNDRYRIERCITTEGGQGLVYQAWDQKLERFVAVKETIDNEAWAHDAINRERKLLVSLDHPGLTNIYDFFVENKKTYLVMNYIPDDNLATSLKKRGKAFPPEEVLKWGDQLLDMLEYLQKFDLVHRDIKPNNLVVNGRGQVVLLDFGIAKKMSSITFISGGTLHYASPEQLLEENTDARSDLYSLGATLYHLITAVQPPDALTRQKALLKGQSDPLLPANKLNSGVKPQVSNILMWALALEREKRPSTAAEMRKALQYVNLPSIDEQETIIRSDNPRESVKKSPRIVIPLNSNEQYRQVPEEEQRQRIQKASYGTEIPKSHQTKSASQAAKASTSIEYTPTKPRYNKLLIWGSIMVTIALLILGVVILSRYITDPDINNLTQASVEGNSNKQRNNNATETTSNVSASSSQGSSTTSSAQVDEILNRYVQSVGGKDAIERITSLIQTGIVEFPTAGTRGTIEYYSKEPNKMYSRVTIPGFGTIQEGFNGEVGWSYEPMSGLREKKGQELAESRRDSEYYNSIKLKGIYSKMELLRKGKIRDREAYVILATPTDGSPDKLYFDTQTGLLIHEEKERETPEGRILTETRLEDYKEVGGILIPFTLHYTGPNYSFIVKYLEVKHNVPIEDTKFDVPKIR